MKTFYKNPIFIFIVTTIVCFIFDANNTLVYTETSYSFLGFSLADIGKFEIYKNFLNSVLLSFVFSKTLKTRYVLISVYLSMIILNFLTNIYIGLALWGYTLHIIDYYISFINYSVFNVLSDKTSVENFTTLNSIIQEHIIMFLVVGTMGYITYLLSDRLIVIPVKNFIKKKKILP